VAFTFFPVMTLAYNITTNKISIPYEITTINNNLQTQSHYLGELKGDPHMYEFVLGSSTELNIHLMQKEEEEIIPLSLIVVKQNEDKGGVTEIGRLSGDKINWQKNNDKVLGLSFNQSDVFLGEINPGIYRVEVSTPDNFGKYVLVVGDNFEMDNYFTTLSNIYTFQTFFGGSVFSMFKSSYIYYPLGIILISSLFYFTWRKRHQIKGIRNA
jgi:hypothetical protein